MSPDTPGQEQLPPKSNRLKMPAGISSQGPVIDITEAYLKAMIALPEILLSIYDEISVISLYFEKKGLREGTFTEEDLEGENKDGSGDFKGC